jgi:hypothetical protein
MRARPRRLAASLAALASLFVAGGARAAANAYADWAVVVVSGDDHAAHVDRATAAFDNARRDVAAGLALRGFSPADMAQVSVRDGESRPGRAEPDVMATRLAALARHATGGCLVYVTSHGSPQGILIGDELVPPRALASMIRQACPRRPTAVVLSACYSGVFVRPMAAALGTDGFVLTAARRDRSSVGCGEDDRYPFFDGCVIATLPAARDFPDLADRVRACVARREDEEGMRPRSEPQLFVGRAFRSAAPAFPMAGDRR